MNGSTDQSTSNKWMTSAFHVNGKGSSTKVEEMICIICLTDIFLRNSFMYVNLEIFYEEREHRESTFRILAHHIQQLYIWLL